MYSVGLQLTYGEYDADYIHIISIRTKSRERNKGSARVALTQLLNDLDVQYGLPISLEASPLDKRTDLGRLVRFYESLGFKCTGKFANPACDPVMVRPSPKVKTETKQKLRF
jgi:ribosomal protein S18 acetylase RimI-like enzyme